MKKSLFLKTFTALILSSFLVLSAGTANAKRLTAAVADWTGGEITCQVAVSMLEQELNYEVERIEDQDLFLQLMELQFALQTPSLPSD